MISAQSRTFVIPACAGTAKKLREMAQIN